jgi:glycosyltransferase involved in cell wall biosynthesis
MKEDPRRSVLFLIPTLTGGGAERVIVTLLKALDRSRFRLAIGVVDMRKTVYRDDIPSDVEIIDIGVTRVRYALPKIIALVWKRRPDVVFSTLGHLNLALAMVRPLLPRGVRYIARETSIVSCTLQAHRWPAGWATLYRWFYKRHDLLVCQSRYMQTDLVEQFGYPTQCSVVINNPVDIDLIRERSTASLDHSRRGDGKIRLVAAGRMSEVKGFDLLIEAIALLADSRIHLALLGEGPLRDELEQLAAARGVADQVEFVGFQSNPYAWFARADVFVLSSRFEGFPNVVLEALACGTPVIAMPAPGGIREILDSIPECVVAEEISARSLADAIGAWLRGDHGRVGPAAVAPYALDRIVGQYENLLLSAWTTTR